VAQFRYFEAGIAKVVHRVIIQDLHAFLRSEFDREARSGFPLAKRIPDTRVKHVLNYHASLDPSAQEKLANAVTLRGAVWISGLEAERPQSIPQDLIDHAHTVGGIKTPELRKRLHPAIAALFAPAPLTHDHQQVRLLCGRTQRFATVCRPEPGELTFPAWISGRYRINRSPRPPDAGWVRDGLGARARQLEFHRRREHRGLDPPALRIYPVRG
jgi:hypothetical protein